MNKTGKKYKIAIAQVNFVVGDIDSNYGKIIESIERASVEGADLVVFSEMAITGYPCEDLLLRPSFRRRAIMAIDELVRYSSGKKIDILLGGISLLDKNDMADFVYNSVFLISDGKMVFTQHKTMLPNYGVFDEMRLFSKSDQRQKIFEWRGIRLGLMICEDLWDEDNVIQLIAQSPDLIITINASPYENRKFMSRQQLMNNIVKKHSVPIMYVNLIGGQDELVFDGRSFVLNGDGKEMARLEYFKEDFRVVEFSKKGKTIKFLEQKNIKNMSEKEKIYLALCCGLRDYVEKNQFDGVLIGISGGIDSALCTALAVDSLGSDRVTGIFMPSQFTSKDSVTAAKSLSKSLGIKLKTVSIKNLIEDFDKALLPIFTDYKNKVVKENIQARLRGNILMSVSNEQNLLLLSTGNKSEIAIGYTTLYGDMCGGFCPLKDVYKTKVFSLARWRNNAKIDDLLAGKTVIIPDFIIDRPPSAELRFDQRDTDELPEYEILDAILIEMIENSRPVEDIIDMGFEREVVEMVSVRLYNFEFKRRQSAPGIKVTNMAFGRDRRYPISNGYIYTKVHLKKDKEETHNDE